MPDRQEHSEICRGREYRVVWQREGFGRRVKLYQRSDAAARWADRLRGIVPVPEEDPEAFACCSGYECGCGGITNREAREQERERYAEIPPLISGPLIESRPVGDWSKADR